MKNDNAIKKDKEAPNPSQDMNEFRVLLIGKGNVGTSFLKLLNEKLHILKRENDLNIKLIGVFEVDGALIDENGIDIEILLDKGGNFRELSSWQENRKAKDLIKKLKPHVCIDTTPTNSKTGEPAMSHLYECLKNSIDFITSNKAPFYLKYKEIKELSRKSGSIVKYEATVASGVPVLSIKQYLQGTEITGIRAILNGTSNYILSRMSAEKIPFSLALKEVQELGYAEADPTLDVEGIDAAGKLVILANEILGWKKSMDDVLIQGITKVTPQAIELALSDGYVIKHLAIAENENLLVEPRLVEKDSPLNISGTLNVIELNTKHAGPIILIGRGAGGFEAASAILNDLYAILKERKYIN
ncbi:MAG: homoserine dehydrogenase [Promethearchaeota archaeon]